MQNSIQVNNKYNYVTLVWNVCKQIIHQLNDNDSVVSALTTTPPPKTIVRIG